ncbi:MAG: Gfo/Idh/MocA family oxidoreductase [Bryobacteraceae bacterium]
MKIGLAGLGFMGSTHVRAYSTLPNVTLAAVCSRHPSRLAGELSDAGGNIGEAGRFDFSGLKKYDSLEGMFADPDLEAVDLCLPTHAHEAAVVAALAAGKHVMVEKPMSFDHASCQRMIAAAKQAGRILMTAQVLRFFPTYTCLETAIPNLGTIRTAAFRRRCAMPRWGAWFTDRSKSGGGIFDLLIHDVDMCLHLFGTPVAVSASGFEDLANAVDLIDARFHYAQGRTITIRGGWHPGAFPFSMDYTIVGDAGTIEFSSIGKPPTLYGTSETSELPIDGPDGYASEIAYFAECCRTNTPPVRCAPEDSAEAVRLAILMRDSRELNGERISV